MLKRKTNLLQRRAEAYSLHLRQMIYCSNLSVFLMTLKRSCIKHNISEKKNPNCNQNQYYNFKKNVHLSHYSVLTCCIPAFKYAPSALREVQSKVTYLLLTALDGEHSFGKTCLLLPYSPRQCALKWHKRNEREKSQAAVKVEDKNDQKYLKNPCVLDIHHSCLI